MARKPWIVPISGTRNIDHLNKNLGARHLELSAAELQAIETAFTKIKVNGGRISEAFMRDVDKT